MADIGREGSPYHFFPDSLRYIGSSAKIVKADDTARFDEGQIESNIPADNIERVPPVDKKQINRSRRQTQFLRRLTGWICYGHNFFLQMVAGHVFIENVALGRIALESLAHELKIEFLFLFILR